MTALFSLVFNLCSFSFHTAMAMAVAATPMAMTMATAIGVCATWPVRRISTEIAPMAFYSLMAPDSNKFEHIHTHRFECHLTVVHTNFPTGKGGQWGPPPGNMATWSQTPQRQWYDRPRPHGSVAEHVPGDVTSFQPNMS